MIRVLQMRKLRHKEIQYLAKVAARQLLCWDLNSWGLAPGIMLLTTRPLCFRLMCPTGLPHMRKALNKDLSTEGWFNQCAREETEKTKNKKNIEVTYIVLGQKDNWEAIMAQSFSCLEACSFCQAILMAFWGKSLPLMEGERKAWEQVLVHHPTPGPGESHTSLSTDPSHHGPDRFAHSGWSITTHWLYLLLGILRVGQYRRAARPGKRGPSPGAHRLLLGASLQGLQISISSMWGFPKQILLQNFLSGIFSTSFHNSANFF